MKGFLARVNGRPGMYVPAQYRYRASVERLIRMATDAENAAAAELYKKKGAPRFLRMLDVQSKAAAMEAAKVIELEIQVGEEPEEGVEFDVKVESKRKSKRKRSPKK